MADELKKKCLDSIDQIDDSSELFNMLIWVMAELRSPRGCVWDREQDHESIKKNLIEETYEAVESIEKKDMKALKEELGDLLLQIVFHSQIGIEKNEFGINDVLKGIINKLVRRHPHVFGESRVKDSKEVLTNWESIKKEERRQKNQHTDSIFSNIPLILPALHYAFEIQRRAARLGFDWENYHQVFDKLEEELAELNEELKSGNKKETSDEIGDLLFTVVNLSRKLDIDCEDSLRSTCKKFIKRFDLMEKFAQEEKTDFNSLSLLQMDRLWDKAKKEIP